MSFKIRGKKSPLFITLLLVLTLFAGLTAGYFSAHGITENGKFEAFSRKVFQNEVSGSTLTLHYTLAHPEKQGIPRKSLSWHRPHRHEKYISDLQPIRRKAEILSLQPPFHGKPADSGFHAPLLSYGKISGRQLSSPRTTWAKSRHSGPASRTSGGIRFL